ncbi:MAG: hypothetical protein J6B15_05975 [Muribaculaceae bacterium]|nr:hypothetical protein [Muribaculaceae bacterium]
MNRIVKWLKHKLERVVLLDDVVVDNLSLKIVERHYRVFFKSTRSIEDSFGGWLSGIYIDKKECHQPFLSKIQQLILQWSKASEPKNAIVFGCAGCSIPRFLYLSYPRCKTVGIELKPQLISIARKYFEIESYNNFKLVQYDALKYFEIFPPTYEKFDLQIVDLFNGPILESRVFSEQFLSKLLESASDRSITIFNLHKNCIDLRSINLSKIGFKSVLLYSKRRYHLICIKSKDSEMHFMQYITRNYRVINQDE